MQGPVSSQRGGSASRWVKSILIAIATGFAIVVVIPDAVWVSLRLESALVLISSAVIAIVSALLVLEQRLHGESSKGLTFAFLATAFLSVLAGSTRNEQLASWIQRLSSLTLGTGFILEWSPFPDAPSRRRLLSLFLTTVCGLGFFYFLEPNVLPPAIANGKFTLPILFCTLCSAQVYLLAALFRWRHFIKINVAELPLFWGCLFLGVLTLVYGAFAPWSLPWWLHETMGSGTRIALVLWLFLDHYKNCFNR